MFNTKNRGLKCQKKLWVKIGIVWILTVFITVVVFEYFVTNKHYNRNFQLTRSERSLTASDATRELSFQLLKSSLSNRIALCISGNTRTFHLPIVHENILKNVLHPLQSRYLVDVFFNVKLQDNPKPGFRASKSTAEETRKAMALFHPVLIRELSIGDNFQHKRMTSDYGGGLSRDIPVPPHCNGSHSGSQRLFSTAMASHSLYRSYQCKSIIEDWEKGHSIKYAYIYRSRPDIVFLDPIEDPLTSGLAGGKILTNLGPWDNTVKAAHWWHRLYFRDKVPTYDGFKNFKIGDHFMGMARQDSDIALSAVWSVEECPLYSFPGDRNSEAQLAYWLLSRGLTPVVGQWLWVLVRDGIGPECRRVQGFSVHRELRKKMEKRCNKFAESFRMFQRN